MLFVMRMMLTAAIVSKFHQSKDREEIESECYDLLTNKAVPILIWVPR